MAEQTHIHELVREVLEQLSTPTENDQAQDQGKEAAEENVQHYYLVSKEELEQFLHPQPEPTIVDAATTVPQSTNTPPTEATQERIASEESGEPEQETVPPPPPVQKRRRGKLVYMLIPLALLIILAIGSLTYLFLLPTIATASITIVPTAKTIHQVLTLPIATSPTQKGVQGRALQIAQFSASKSVPVTGKGHQKATVAHGTITFYNGMAYSQTINAGTILTGRDGIAVVTEQDAIVPGTTPPVEGQFTVPAHNLTAGSNGNIPIGDIYDVSCCASGIQASNLSPFQGGLDERFYSYVTGSDIDNASHELTAKVTQKAESSLARQLQSGESLISPLCTPRTTADHQEGEEATEVRVTVVQTCKSIAYTTASLEHIATSLLVSSQKLDHYKQIGATELTISKATTDGKTVHITINISGIWVYAFSQADLHYLKWLIHGLSPSKAQELLQREPGIDQATIYLHRFDSKNELPRDPNKITFQFFYVVS